MSVEARGAHALRDAYLTPTAYKYLSHNRTDASFVDLGAIVTSGQPRVALVSLPAGFVFTKMKWFSGATALATGVNQWCALIDTTLTVLAVSADRTTTAWAANAGKEFTFSSTSLRRPPSVYYAVLVVNATTPPSLKGTLDSDALLATEAPILGGNSATTALATPSAVGTVFGAITASGSKPVVMIG